MTSLARRPWWTLPAMGLVAMLPIIVRRVGDPDYWWHVLTGQWMWQHRSVATHELYTYTISGAPWTDHEYGSQFLFYALSRVGGLLLVSLFFGGLVWAGFLLLYAQIRTRDHAPLVAGAALLLGSAAGFPVWGPRPQMFDFTFVALELYLIERFLAGRTRALWPLPVVTAVWANVHGGFVFCFLFLGLLFVSLLIRWLAAGRARGLLLQARTVVLVALASLVGSLLTPHGPALFVYVLRTQFSSQLSSFVREWQSPDFHMAEMLPFGAFLLLVFVGFIWRRPRVHDLLFIIATAVLAMRAWLFIPITVAAATPVLASQWSLPWSRCREWLRASRAGRPRAWIGGALLVALALGTVASLGLAGYTLRGQTSATRANYPVAAADYLVAHPALGTHLFNEYSWGGYVAYRFYGQANRRLFIYGESELMGDSLLSRYSDVNTLAPDWEAVLDRYGVDYILFPAGTALTTVLSVSPLWQLVYADGLADIFIRRPGP